VGRGMAAAPIAANGLDRSAGPTDHDLVAAVRRGDDRAFEQLYGRYQRRIAAYVYGMVNDYARAEDITQDVFISALRRMRETERPIAFKPWIYEIAKNACIDQFRRSRRAEEVSYDAEEGLGAADYGRLVTTGPTLDAAVDTKQQLSHLCGAFGGLSETHHQILVLRELEGLSYREIGERMGLSRPSVESTLFRARRRLTEEYDELVSGQRCVRIQGIIGAAGESDLGARDTRRLARHIAHCQPCRRQAIAAGIDTGTIRRPMTERVAAKVAGLFPFPLLERFKRGSSDAAAQVGGGGQGLLAQMPAVSAAAEPLVHGWGKAAAAAATVMIASAGAGAMTDRPGGAPLPVRSDAAAPATTARAVEAAAKTPAFAAVTRQPKPLAAVAPVAPQRGTDAAEAGSGSGAPATPGAPAVLGEPPADSGVPPEFRDGPKLPTELQSDASAGSPDPLAGMLPNEGKGEAETTPPITQELEDQARAVDPQLGDAVSDLRDAVGG
jgi:RNA polymerase sigma factor (sigma-70 family)